MPMGFRMLPPAAALVAVLVLAGCVPTEPPVTPEPDPQVTPVFASDEEALAAATEAYRKYLEVFDAVFAGGGVDTQALEAVLVGHQLEVERKGLVEAAAAGIHGVGSSTFNQFSLQRVDSMSVGADIVTAYVCEDISGVDVLDSEDVSIVDSERRARSLYEVTFDYVSDESVLKVSDKELWTEEPC